MAEIATMTAEPKEGTGKGTARAMRRAGRVPGIIYGGEAEPIMVSVDYRELVREIERGGFANRLYDVAVAGGSERVLPREIQLHPVSDSPMHVDFLRLSADSRISIMVPTVFIDDEESPGIKRGGVLNVVRHEIEFWCRADAIPETITVSLAGLDIGDSVHIEEIDLPDGVSPTITDRNFTVATIAAPTVVLDEAAEAAAAAEAEELEGEEGEEGVEGEEGEAAEGEAAEGEGSEE